MALGIGEHTVIGVLSGVEPKTNGWFRFSIAQEGSQYPDKVDTSKPEIIAQAMALIGQPVAALVNVQDSGTPNPHRPGENYKNRYLNAIGPAGSMPQPAQEAQAQPQAAQPQQAQGDPFTPDARDLKIYRQVAYKTAIDSALQGAIEFTPSAIVEAAEVAMGYLRYGPDRFGVVSHEQRTFPQQAQAAPVQGTLTEQPPHPADDDIPF